MLRSAEERVAADAGDAAAAPRTPRAPTPEELRQIPEPEPEPEEYLEPEPEAPPLPHWSPGSFASDEDGRDSGTGSSQDDDEEEEEEPLPPWLAARVTEQQTADVAASVAKIPGMAMAASAAMKNGDLDGAVLQYTKAIACVPNSAAPGSDLRRRAAALYNSRAAVLFELGRFRQALRDSDESVLADGAAFSSDRQPQLRGALCCLRLGELAESRRRFEELDDPELPFLRHLAAAEEAEAAAVECTSAAAGACGADQWRAAADGLLRVCDAICPKWLGGWVMRCGALCAAGNWESGEPCCTHF